MKFRKLISTFIFLLIAHISLAQIPLKIVKEEFKNMLCYGQDSAWIKIHAQYGNPPYKFALYEGNTMIDAYASRDSFIELGEGSYRVDVRDAFLTVVESSIFIITEPPRDTIALDLSINDTMVCPGRSIAIRANIKNERGGTGPYYCTVNGTKGKLPFYVSPKVSPTIYEVTAKEKDGCFVAKETISIRHYPAPEVSLDAREEEYPYRGCAPYTLYLKDTVKDNRGKRNYKWDFKEDDLDDNTYEPRFVFENEGIYPYRLTVTSADGCVKRILDTVRVYESVEAKFTANPYEASYLKPLVAFENQSLNHDSCYWTFGDDHMYNDTLNWYIAETLKNDTVFGSNGEIITINTTVIKDTIYEIQEYDMTSNLEEPYHFYEFAKPNISYEVQLIVSSFHSCRDTFKTTVRFLDEYTFYTPNVIYPNSKIEENRLFKPKGMGIDRDNFEMKIFNRWGNIVFETSNLEYAWDGKINGGDYGKAGTYVWVIWYKDISGTEYKKTGSISLIF